MVKLLKMGDNAADKRTEEEAPFPLTDVDRWVLSQTDEDFHLHDWDELKIIIGKLELALICCKITHSKQSFYYRSHAWFPESEYFRPIFEDHSSLSHLLLLNDSGSLLELI